MRSKAARALITCHLQCPASLGDLPRDFNWESEVIRLNIQDHLHSTRVVRSMQISALHNTEEQIYMLI